MVLEQGLTGVYHSHRETGDEQGLFRTQIDLADQLANFLRWGQACDFSPQTTAGYKRKLGQFIRFAYQKGIHYPQDVTASLIIEFMLDLKLRCNGTTVHNHYRALKRLFNWMIEQGELARHPMAKMKSPRLPVTVIRPFQIEHIRRMLVLCEDGTFTGIRNKAIILIFLDTGLRLSELSNLMLNDLDFDREAIKVMGKGARERVVRMSKPTQKAILLYFRERRRRWHDTLPNLWVSEECRPINSWGIQIMIRRLGKRCGISGVRCSPHTFRHTFATMAIRNNANLFYVQSILGHSTLTMCRRYAKTIDSEDAVKAHVKFSPVDNMRI